MMQSSYGSSYDELIAQMQKHIRAQKINEEIFSLLQSAAGRALAAQNVVISQPEKTRVLQSVMNKVLSDLVKKIDQS
jgi:septation ring formation regulator EzrA